MTYAITERQQKQTRTCDGGGNAPFRGIGIQVLDQPTLSTRFHQVHEGTSAACYEVEHQNEPAERVAREKTLQERARAKAVAQGTNYMSSNLRRSL